MEPDIHSWNRLEELFAAAVELPPDRQRAFVVEETGSDAGLRDELLRLLEHDRGAGTRIAQAIDEVAKTAAGPTEWIGSRVGPYRIVREIGRGGMGIVFLAVRDDDEYHKTVALKIAPWWRDPTLLHDRFRHERQILAGLDHPNIARFLDGGTHAGTPYFAMEFIEGSPITRYVRQHQLTIGQRIELFRTVCASVHYAHQRLVVHRDLKPSNILVTDDGTPKLLDFGIAKLLTPVEESNPLTVTGATAWTPDYASPEQIRSQPVTTSTDVYSLGLVLFELLTGERAQSADTSSPLALDRSVCEAETPRLSARVPQTLARQLAGDLDTIVAKATQKDPERRYTSVAEFSDDLGRYLDGRPVRARRDTSAYRLAKFLRRNWLPVSAASVAVVGLAAGAIGFAWQARVADRNRVIAEQQRMAAEQQRDRAEKEHNAADQQRAAAVTARSRAEQMAGEAQSERRRADVEAASAKAVSEFLRNDLLSQATAHGQAAPGAKPDPDLKVRTALDRAAERLGGRFPDQPLVEADIRQTIADAYDKLGLFPEARRQYERALELRRKNLGEEHADTVLTEGALAGISWEQGKRAEAATLFRQVFEKQRRTLGEHHPETLKVMGSLAVVAVNDGQTAEAERLFSLVIEGLRKTRGEEDEETLTAMSNLAALYANTGRSSLAIPLNARIAAVRTRIQGEEHPITLLSLNNLATDYVRDGRFEQAGVVFAKVLEVQRRLLGPEHPQTLTSLSNLAKTRSELGNYAEAESLYSKLLEIRRRVLGDKHPSIFITMNNLAAVYRNQGRLDEAESLENQVVETQRQNLGEDHRETMVARQYLGLIYLRQGRYADAEALFAKLVDARRRVLGATHIDTIRTLVSLGEARLQQKKYAQAEAPLREALRNFESSNSDNWVRYHCQSLLGAALTGLARYSEAEPLLLAGHDGLQKRMSAISAESRSVVPDAASRIGDLYRLWGKPEKAAQYTGK